MPKTFTILFAPVYAVRHINACIGVAEILQLRGHQIVFMVNQSFKEAFVIND